MGCTRQLVVVGLGAGAFLGTLAVADVTALAEGLTEESVTGLSRFSYLRVISRGAVSGRGEETAGARYVIEGSIRRVGAGLRIAVQLIDAGTGAHLWAETYERQCSADAVFALQDDLARCRSGGPAPVGQGPSYSEPSARVTVTVRSSSSPST